MRTLAAIFAGIVAVVALLFGAGLLAFQYYTRSLPDYQQLASYEPPITSRVYAGDGHLLAEFASEKRIFVPISVIPKQVVQGFLSAEDKNFYDHPGVDIAGVIRAVITNIEQWGSDRRPVGASTITQQVAKNFLLSNEVTIERKIKEAVLAFRMSRAFSKDRILELYLNQIYLGNGSYGVAAAALNYFNKSLDELSVSEIAFLAALPKAPSHYDPDRHPDAARARRDWVIGRMQEDGYLTAEEADGARAEPLVTVPRKETEVAKADYFTEEVRRDFIRERGERALYEGGFTVHTTLDTHLQEIADETLRNGLEAFDRHQGRWRGPLARIPAQAVDTDWQAAFNAQPRPTGIGSRSPALVLKVDDRAADIGFLDGTRGRIPFSEMRWARPKLRDGTWGAAARRPGDLLDKGDIIAVEPRGNSVYALRQPPEVDGALVAIDPHTGRVLAMAGGYDYERSQFNRATQAMRQPGSAFKPFVYLTAMENGYTPSSIILDAPISFSQGEGLPAYSPSNYSERYYGPTTLRVGIEKSRNVMTVRLANEVGMDRVVNVAERFGIVDQMPPYLAYALGAGETTLMRLTAAYAMLNNGGYKITPSVIDRIQDRYGRTVYRHDQRRCDDCIAEAWEDQPPPQVEDDRKQVTDPQSAYQLVSMLEGVVERGTGIRVKEVGKPLAGKTGTSNDAKDLWFVGFSSDLVVGVFVGYDDPRSLGAKQTGGSVAAPIFRDFMAAALDGKAAIPFRIPPGIRLVRVIAANGQLASGDGNGVILEAFKPGTLPQSSDDPLPVAPKPPAQGPRAGTGGLY